MNIPDETLMAYADGELDPAQCAEVEAAIAADPRLAARVEQHRALRRQLNAALDPVLLETVPNVLVSTVHGSPAARQGTTDARGAATVTDLRRVRAARAAEAKEAAAFARRAQSPRGSWTWFEWGAMALCLTLGALITHLATRSAETSRIATAHGRLVAQADLAKALSTQLVIDQSVDAPVQIGVSFETKSGDICRTFTIKEQNVLGGLACREQNLWRVHLLEDAPPGSNDHDYKPAGGSMPASVVAAVEKQIKGEPLDASEEAAARARGWH